MIWMRIALPVWAALGLFAGSLFAEDNVEPVRLFLLNETCEGIVFDHEGNGYVSYGRWIEKFSLDGRHSVWSEPGSPNGHKILADGTHLVCNGKQVIKLSADGKVMGVASESCNGEPLRGVNDLSLDVPHGGFYFTDPGGSSREKPIGTIHYVTAEGKTLLVDSGLAFPNGIALSADGKRLHVAESQHNRILIYDVVAPGRVANKREFAKLPTANPDAGQVNNEPDGICLDRAGNLYVAHYGMRQVQVLSPQGELIKRLPGGNVRTTNVAFGGPDHQQLFVSGGWNADRNWGGVFRLSLDEPGLVILPSQGEP